MRFLPQQNKFAFTFIAHQSFYTQILAYRLDSLVRVSRRVNENHFVRIANAQSNKSPVTNRDLCRTLFFKITARKGPPSAALRSALSWFLRQRHSLANGYKFQPPSLVMDYLPLTFFCASYLILTHHPYENTTLAPKCGRFDEIPICPLTTVVSMYKRHNWFPVLPS